MVAEHSGGLSREQLIQKNQALREENTQLWNWLSLTIEFLLVKQHEFSAVALAMGLSLTQIAVLLALLLLPRHERNALSVRLSSLTLSLVRLENPTYFFAGVIGAKAAPARGPTGAAQAGWHAARAAGIVTGGWLGRQGHYRSSSPSGLPADQQSRDRSSKPEPQTGITWESSPASRSWGAGPSPPVRMGPP